MAKFNQHKMIKEIEDGKYKYKSLYYILRSLEALRIGVNYGSSFLIPFINMSAGNGNITGAVTGLGLLLSRDGIYSTLDAMQSQISMKFEIARQEYMMNNQLKLLQRSKGVVTEETTINQEINGKIIETKQQRVIQNPEIASKIGKYFTTSSQRKDRLPGMITEMGASALAFAGAIGTTLSTGGNPIQTVLALAAGIGVGAGSMIYANRKRKINRKQGIEAESKAELYRNELLNTEPVNETDKEFIVSRAVLSNIDASKIWNRMRTTYNKVDILNNLVFSGALASLCLGQIGGIINLTPQTVLGMTSMIYFYSDILGKISRSIRSVKDLTEMRQDYKQTGEIVKDIAEQIEHKKDRLHAVDSEFETLHIKDFEGKFYAKTSGTEDVYKEHRLFVAELQLKKGETVLISGESGSGKTTLFKMLRNGDINNTGSILVDEKERVDNIGNTALFYTPTIHLSNSEDVLHEITCGRSIEDLSEEKRKRLREILKGLKLEDMSNNLVFRNDGLKLLSQKTYDEFSVGQQQRLVLAKMLYLLNDEHQMVILDEPTANLDKESAEQVFQFITRFCNRDKQRIILMSSHQTDIATRYADKRYHIENGILKEVPIERNFQEPKKEASLVREPSRTLDKKRDMEPEYYI